MCGEIFYKLANECFNHFFFFFTMLERQKIIIHLIPGYTLIKTRKN